MTKNDEEEDIRWWKFERWERTGSALIARHEINQSAVWFDENGELTFGYIEDVHPSVPASVLRRLIADAIERKVPGWA